MSLPPSRLGQVLGGQQLGVHTHHQHLFVVRAVEDADRAALREGALVAPQEVVLQVLGGRYLEADDGDALRVHAAHDVLDRPVLAGRVHGLQYDQQRVAVLGRQACLVFGQQLDALGEILLSVRLLDEMCLVPGVEVAGQRDRGTGRHAERRDQLAKRVAVF